MATSSKQTQKRGTLLIANKEIFEVVDVANYEQEIKDFIRNIQSNNHCKQQFCKIIQFLNPLSNHHRNVFAKLTQNRGCSIIKPSSSLSNNLDETIIICYLIEYTVYAQNIFEKEDKNKNKRDGGDSNTAKNRKKIFDRLIIKSDIRPKLKDFAISLDVLSLLIACVTQN